MSNSIFKTLMVPALLSLFQPGLLNTCKAIDGEDDVRNQIGVLLDKQLESRVRIKAGREAVTLLLGSAHNLRGKLLAKESLDRLTSGIMNEGMRPKLRIVHFQLAATLSQGHPELIGVEMKLWQSAEQGDIDAKEAVLDSGLFFFRRSPNALKERREAVERFLKASFCNERDRLDLIDSCTSAYYSNTEIFSHYVDLLVEVHESQPESLLVAKRVIAAIGKMRLAADVFP